MSRLEAPSSYISKTLLFSVWNGQVLFTFLTCMTSHHFMSLVTRIWTWHLEILPPCPTCSSLYLDFTCWSPLWFSSICSLPWCQTHIRGFNNNLMWSGSLDLPSWSDQCTEQTCRHPQSIWSPHGWCISSECARKVSYLQFFNVRCFLTVLTTGKKSKVEDYSRLQESSSAKSTGMFKKSKFTEENEHLVHDYYQLFQPRMV